MNDSQVPEIIRGYPYVLRPVYTLWLETEENPPSNDNHDSHDNHDSQNKHEKEDE